MVNADFLKRVFTDTPSDFGFRCSGGREVIALPGVKVFDAASGTLLHRLELSSGPVSLTFSGDGKTLLVLDANTTYTWLDIASGGTLKTWKVVSLISSELLGADSSLFLE